MRTPGKRTYALVGGILCIAALLTAGIVYWRVGGAIHGAEKGLESERNLAFVSRPYLPPVDTGFEWVSSPAVFTEAAEFQGHLFVAGPAGLSEFDDRGHALRDFRVGRELPSSPLVRIEMATLADSREPELVLATADAGLLVFNGASFRQIAAEDRDARSITAILASASGRLLIGTQKRGVLVYDGHRLGPFHPSLTGLHVTELSGTDSDLWIGTGDRGVAHFHGGAVDWFDESSGLPDAHVYCIAQQGRNTFVGTSTGIAEFEDGKFVRVLAAGAFVRSLLPQEKTLLAGTMDDGILEIALSRSSRNQPQPAAAGSLNEVEQLIRSNASLYALTAGGVFLRHGAGNWSRVLLPSSSLLSDRNVSALAFDPSGQLWVGYFDRGLDIVDASQKRVRHIEDDHVFCVNRILPGAGYNATAVATANGLALFDARGNLKQVLRKADGLISDHVTDLAVYGRDLVVATPAGITFIGPSGVRSLYAFHGLVNNHVYTLAPNGRSLLAGTLGGVSMLEDDQIRANYTTATSELKANWITAAVPVGDEWWVGTYGAGVVRMDPTGQVEAGDGAGGDLVINPNAMLATDRFVVAGTMGQGMYVMDRKYRSLVGDDRGVAVAERDGVREWEMAIVYVGTDNGLVRIPEQRLGR